MYWGEACTLLQASLVDDWVCQRELVKAKLKWPETLAYRQMVPIPARLFGLVVHAWRLRLMSTRCYSRKDLS
jgi:hypothetical protein